MEREPESKPNRLALGAALGVAWSRKGRGPGGDMRAQ